jgi:hypothetical protein
MMAILRRAMRLRIINHFNKVSLVSITIAPMASVKGADTAEVT